MSSISYRKGAVSIFVVVFTALLITIVAVSFVRLMVRDQQRASDSDLSRSARDSAMVGVEDAKRALARFYNLDPSVRAGYDLTNCNAITQLLTGSSSTDEVTVQTNIAADSSLNQAYTCVQVHTLTDDYDRSVMADETVLIPLTTRDVDQFDRVRIQWFIETDLAEGTSINLPSAGVSVLSQSWPDGRPPVIEAQLIQTHSTFHTDQFDGQPGGNQNTNTLILYPKNIPEPTISFNSDVRRTPKTNVTDVRCTPSFTSKYLCSAMIMMPDPINGDAGSRSNVHLRITPRYRDSQVQVALFNGSSLVQLDGVQPRVDSTGRADDLFRRVSVRVEAGTNAVYPLAAVDVTGNFCKTFAVTDRPDDYDRGSCTP